MAEEHTQQPSTRGKSRRERVEHARSRDILDVASELRMELFQSGRDYRWKDHDSMVISPEKNMWNWFSHHKGGDVIALVQTVKEVNFNQAIDYLNDGTFKPFTSVERAQEDFSYYLKPYEQPFDAARTYLKEQRGLSDETIDFFLEKGVLAQANAKVGDVIEPVLVFKNLDVNGQVVGAALQGLVANPDNYFGRGYLKQIMKNSQPYNGMHVDIGTPDRLIFAESSIDLMSYYELHKDSLSDVRLVSLEGLKTGTMGRHLVQLQSEMERRPLSSRWTDDKLAQGLDEAVKQGYFKDGKNSHLLTLAVDHDAKGKELIQELTDMGVPVIDATPPKAEGQAKMDWNAYLQETKATFSTERYQEEIDNLISDITLGDDAYYLWHDHELVNLGANESIVEEFHSKLEDNRYVVNQAELYVEDSANEGATGYLSLEGHVLDKEGIEDYLSEQTFSDAEKVSFLETLQTELPNVWDKVTNHYDKVFETVVNQYSLKLSAASMISEGIEKPLDGQQEAVSNSEQQKMTGHMLGDLSEITQKAAPLPEATQSQPLNDLLPNQTQDQSFLYFTTSKPKRSIPKAGYHIATKRDLERVNNYASQIQEAARWYLNNLANSSVFYVYQDDTIKKPVAVKIKFEERQFMHLTGLFPIQKGQTAEKTLHDFASGNGRFDNLMVANRGAVYQKLQVLPELQDILRTNAFYFDDVKDIPRLHNIDMATAIKSDEGGFVTAFKNNNDHTSYPASLLELTPELQKEFSQASPGKTILGIYRERDGVLEQMDVNEDYVKDDGERIFSALKNKHYEESLAIDREPTQADNFSAEQFPQHQDRIYKETYHVRLQWLENWPDGPQIPFKETELVEYQTFAKELYKQNSAFYERYQESMATGNQADYIPFTKVQFDVYAPGGILIKDNVRYDIGDETEPISRLLGLGYRRLEGQPELAAIDNKVLSQLENQKVNQ